MSNAYPHVTAILKEAGLIDTTWFTEDMALRGSAVHLACQFLDEGDLDESSLAPDVAPRVASYKKFLAEMQVEIFAVEIPVFSEQYRYQGRYDRLVTLNDRRGILDIKGPARGAWQGVQLAAYARLVPNAPCRWTLHLSDDGYKLIEHTDRDDWPAFQAARTLYAWKENHGCLQSR